MYEVVINEKAENGLQKAYSYYESLSYGLGEYFLSQIDLSISTLENNPFFQIRYSNIRCLPVSKLPFMVHFSISDEMNKVYIYDIIHTSRNPPFS